MNIFELFAKIFLDSSEYDKGLDEAEKKTSSIGQKISGGLTTAAKVGAAAIGTASTAVAKLSQTSVSAYADYEQLVGGVETLYGNTYKSVEEYAAGMGISLEQAGQTWEQYKTRQDTVLENAKNAYRTAGLSANEYMEQVTGFAAALNASLGENAWQSANVADMAITDMADNANKMGTSIESIQNAYAGFAKGNFTMLDNLKLGYGGTKEEMQRLLREAEELEGYELNAFDENNFADIVEAINIVQTHLGIAETTSKEASSTISGSIATMKGAWTNLVAGFADPDADLGNLIAQMVDSAGIALDNLAPAVEQALTGISELITQMAPIIAEKLPELIETLLPQVIEAATNLVSALATALPAIIDVLLNELPQILADSNLVEVAGTILETLVNALIEALPLLIEGAIQLVSQFSIFIGEQLPVLIPAIIDMILAIVDALIDNVDLLIDGAVALMVGLAEGLINALPRLIEKAPVIIAKFVDAIIRNLPKILKAGAEVLGKLVAGIITSLPKLLTAAAQIITTIGKGIAKLPGEALKWGKDMLDGFINGIKSKINAVGDAVKGVASKIKSFLGFSVPEDGPLSDFNSYAPDMMALFAKGVKDNTNLVTDQLKTSFDFSDVIAEPRLSMAGAGAVGGFQPGTLFDNISSMVSEALGGLTIQVNIGQDRVDDLVVKAIQRNNYRSGGR